MADRRPLSKGDWEALLHAPLHVYSAVASAAGEPSEAQFRRLREELEAAHARFDDGTVGRELSDTLAANLDVLWDGYRAAGRSDRDGIKRAAKVLRKNVAGPDAEAIGGWLLSLAVRIADAQRTVGEEAVSGAEATVIRDLSDWLGRPPPRLPG